MPAPPIIPDLIQRFERNREAYHSGTYKEIQLRHEFIDPFFETLGWDVNNKKGFAEPYKDVIHEDAIKIGGITKAPDYCFRIGGMRKFFVEAKKPSVALKDTVSPAFQLRRYAWSAKLPLSILTDFEEFAVYDCWVKPAHTDKASTARIMYVTSTEYTQRWEEISSVFSRDAILKGSFDKYAESQKMKKGTAEVDDAFLAEIEAWRVMLAKNIALRNPKLTQRELNLAVQKTIDRIVFLRICEDRGVEQDGRLLALLNVVNIYKRLGQLFVHADERYNSGIFYFKEEKGRPEPPDTLTLDLIIDDKPLKDIITSLYYPNSPYEFSVLPADILGQVYEQFLGKVIRLTEGHQAKVEDKPEVKKAGGVYYTPTYIVDYIVKNTVGKLIEEKTPKDISKLKILDPACGSGSFLLGAFQRLLDWHRDWYEKDGPEKWAKAKTPVLYQGPGGVWLLTTPEKKRILLNNIFGVDIDPQAVEVTKLSLLLKVLEGENNETLTRQLALFHERALPDLGNNIKCGNSLIAPDFYSSDLFQKDKNLNNEERLRINAFDWHKEFPDIMSSGGFDAVIGNPPYVRQETLGELKEYFAQSYTVYHGMADLYAYFIERGVSLLKPGGLFSYIVANKWMRANYGEPLRKWLKDQCIEEIIDFGDLPVFEKATTYPCIIRINKGKPSPGFQVTNMATLDFQSLQAYVKERQYPVQRDSLDDTGWSLTDERTQALLKKLKAQGIPLGEYVKGKIFRGVLTGLNEAFVIDSQTRKRLIAEDHKSKELIKPFLLGRDIKRYRPLQSDTFLILIPNGWTREQSGNASDSWTWFKRKYPAIAKYLSQFEDKARKRYDKGEYWWELRSCDYYAEFEKPKILYPNICKKPEFAFDEEGFYTNQRCFIISIADKYLLGLFNSTLMNFLFQNILPKLRGGFYEPSYVFFKDFPIRQINFSDPIDKSRHDKIVALVEQMLSLHKQFAATKTDFEHTALQRQIDATNSQIDHLVYELYGLTKDEIKIVEITNQGKEN